MWISFECKQRRHFVVRPFVGSINAISGEPLVGNMTSMLKKLNSVPTKQDYLVLPQQPWLDGIAVSPGQIKQFVATPMLSLEQQKTRDRILNERKQAYGRAGPSRSAETDPFEMGASIELQVTGRDAVGGLQ